MTANTPHTPEWLAAYLRAWADNAPWDTRDEQVLREAADVLSSPGMTRAEVGQVLDAKRWQAEIVRLQRENNAARLCLDYMAAGDDEAAKMAKRAIVAMDRAALPLTEETPDADA